jgi:CRP-like cAMP-binding protein
MAGYTARSNLQTALQQGGEKVHKSRSVVLFRRGDKAFGMFVILSGKVSLDLGVDSAFARCHGPGALVGLPATLTRRDYSMTATVTQDAELRFWSFEALDSLLQNHCDFCRQLLVILGEKMAENNEVTKTFLNRGKQPSPSWALPEYLSGGSN